MWRRQAKALVEAITGREIKRIEPNAIAGIERGRHHEAWFCYDLQLKWLLDLHHVNLALDVGANRGQFAERLRQLYAGEIVSFEPVSEAFARLAESARRDPRWTAHQLALGTENTTASIHVAASTIFSSFLRTSDFSLKEFPRSAADGDEMVSVKRLDDVLDTLVRELGETRLFLKLDTQGFDLEVFRGLGRYRDRVMVMQSEVSLLGIYDDMPHWTESIDAYERAGFAVAGMFPVTRDTMGRVIEYDCLLVRSDDRG